MPSAFCRNHCKDFRFCAKEEFKGKIFILPEVQTAMMVVNDMKGGFQYNKDSLSQKTLDLMSLYRSEIDKD